MTQNGKMALVTGASSGIGEACARQLAARGYGLVLLARRQDRLELLREEILRSSPGVEIHCFGVDVSDRAAVDAFARAQDALLGRVGVLVNNAGLARGVDPIHDGVIEDWEAMIDTNLKGFLYVTHAMLPHLRARAARGGGGSDAHIVNLGSVAARWVYPKGNVYCATKAAVHALNEGMRLDLHGSGVRVTEISPGMVETEFSLVRLGDAERASKVYEGMTPLTADDVAEAVVWCVERPRHVNVQEIVLYPTDQAAPGVVSRRP